MGIGENVGENIGENTGQSGNQWGTATLIYQNDFDSGWTDTGNLIFSGYCDPTGSTRQNPQTNDPFTPSNGQYTLSTAEKRSGTHSAKCIVGPDYACFDNIDTEELKIRSRMVMGDSWSSAKLTWGEEYWLGFSLFIPVSNSLGNPPYTIFMEFFNPSDMNIRSANGNFELSGGDVLGAIVQDQWHDFVRRIQIDPDGNGGFIEDWLDGVKKVSRAYTGGGDHRVTIGGYYGQYGANGEDDTNLPFDVYVDSVKIAQGTNGYSLVNPAL